MLCQTLNLIYEQFNDTKLMYDRNQTRFHLEKCEQQVEQEM